MHSTVFRTTLPDPVYPGKYTPACTPSTSSMMCTGNSMNGCGTASTRTARAPIPVSSASKPLELRCKEPREAKVGKLAQKYGSRRPRVCERRELECHPTAIVPLLPVVAPQIPPQGGTAACVSSAGNDSPAGRLQGWVNQPHQYQDAAARARPPQPSRRCCRQGHQPGTHTCC